MGTMTPLQQTLKSLCSRTGWCYAVFWKLKRRSRMMLTWEDGYYDCSKSAADICRGQSNSCPETGGNPLDQGGSGDGQIGLAVARMSYYVYSMGEGIIGRVAFTGKHQWVFHDGENHLESTPGGILNNQFASEKNPDGWQNQFAAGIKTIAVIAVPQGVVQLGSTKLMMEDLKWIDHIKSVFGALQTAPSAIRPDLLSEGQGGKISYNSMPPFLSGSNTSLAARRAVTMQQGQVQPLLRNSEDAVCRQKFGVQSSPIGIASNIQGLQSRGGTISVAGSVGKTLEYQQALKVLAEPQSTRYASTELGPQTLQVHANVPHFDAPSNCNNKILSCDDTKSLLCDERRAEHLNESTWMGLMTGSMSHCLHNEVKRENAVPTGVGGQVDENLSSPQENYSFKKRFAMRSMPDTKKEECFASVPSSFGAGQQQQLNMQTVPSQKNISSSTSALECDIALKCVDSSSATDKMVNQECFNDVYPAAVVISSHLPAKQSMLQFHTSDDFTAPRKDDAHWNALGRDLNKSESQCSERELLSNNLVSKSDVNTLDELENFLASISREENSNWDCSFAIGDELSQALGPAFWKGGTEEPLTPGGSQKSVELQVGKVSMKQGEIVTNWESKLANENSFKRLLGVCPSENKAEPLLDAIVGNASNCHHSISSSTDASICDKTPFPNLTGGMPMVSISQETEPACNSSLSGKLLHAASHHETMYRDISACGVKNLPSHQNLCVSSDTHTNVTLHSWTDEGQSLKSDDTRHSQSKRSEDLSKSSKKRSRSGESARPRPKDRQQIQDRVRELRDIVPNGSKCSIDALLEKTIKHMLFLHSVTLHADQLKNNGELKEDPDTGASWALDIGDQDKKYPILVKDLNQPRQMLVEMMCEESGLFLEIADIIRSLGLSILRGVMESHKDKFLAKFVVEANRDVQRVDVLVSLIQRLHLDNSSSSSSMTMASQSAALLPQQGVDSSSSHKVGGNK
eukprot:c15984_g1_i1 orf=699-3614(-)